MRRPALLLGLLAVLAVGVVVLVDALVVTDEEAIEAVVDQAAAAVRKGDFKALRALLADDYEGEGGDAEGAVGRARRGWEDLGGENLHADLLDLSVQGDEAQGVVKIGGSLLGRPGAASLHVGFQRIAEGWRIASAHLTGAARAFRWRR